MNKNILTTAFILTLLLTTKAYCEVNAQNFIRHFSSCTKFMVNGDNRVHVMLGWSNRKCFYKEFSINEEVICGFKILELQELSKAMKEENFKPEKGITSLNAAQKYLSMPDRCIVETR